MMKLKRIVLTTLLGISLAPASAILGSTSAQADDVVRWKTIIGIIQPHNLVGSGTGQVTGGGSPWSALGGEATVNLRTGHIEFNVRGLVRAGGNAIGIPESLLGPLTGVKGSLVCDTDGSAGGGNSTLVDTDLVPISSTGNARFSGFVAVPAACLEPDIAFLVRILDGGVWIANGAVRQSDRDSD